MTGRVIVSGRIVASALCAVLILSSLGCGGEKAPPLFPVSGKVMYQGKPVAGAKVAFVAANEDPKKPSAAGRAGAETDADGAYELSWGKDQLAGCPAGNFKVIIFAFQDLGDQADDEVKPPSLIPEMYNNPVTSGLKATVKEEDNEINFNLEGSLAASAGPSGRQRMGPGREE